MSDNTTKRCTKCGNEYPATSQYFNKDKSKPLGLYPSCKQCVADYGKTHRLKTDRDKKRYWNNRESELARNKEYQQRKKAARPPRILKTDDEYKRYKREWYIAHRDISLKRSKARREANPEEIKLAAKNYRQNNRPKVRAEKSAYKARRRARIIEAGGQFKAKDVALQYKSQKGLCWWCGKPVGDNYHVDHLTPLARGGSNEPRNIVISCPHCNCSRQDKMPHEWSGRLL